MRDLGARLARLEDANRATSLANPNVLAEAVRRMCVADGLDFVDAWPAFPDAVARWAAVAERQQAALLARTGSECRPAGGVG